MSGDAIGAGAGAAKVSRFSLAQRIEHFVLILSFNVLAFTGLPQKYFYTGWAERIIQLLGGIERVRFIHRTFAVILIAEALWHIGAVIAARRAGRDRGDMGLNFQDVRGVLGDIAYLIGLRRSKPAFGRYDYRQKLEYWAVVWGTAIMATTGLIMWFPETLARYVPGGLASGTFDGKVYTLPYQGNSMSLFINNKLFAAAGLVITFLGAFFRGPGYGYIVPWENGLWFAL